MALAPSAPFAFAAFSFIVLGIIGLLRRSVPKAYALGAIVLMVALVQSAGTIFRGESVGYALGFQSTEFLDGKWFAPLTAMFVHSGLFHLAGNLILLLAAGPALEERIGARRFLIVYFSAGLAGFLAHLALSYMIPHIVPPEQTALGASGAIFGILTTYAVRYPRATLPIFLGFLIWMPAFAVLLIHMGLNLVHLISDYQGISTGIAWWGHFAGFLVGLPFAYTLPKHHEAMPTGTRGLPDPDKLEPLATTPKARQMLAKVRQFTPDARTQHDSTFALAWVDRFLETAACPQCGASFTRSGLKATCRNGETTVDFARD